MKLRCVRYSYSCSGRVRVVCICLFKHWFKRKVIENMFIVLCSRYSLYHLDWLEDPVIALSNLDLHQVPPSNPHNRKTGPAEEEEEDLVDKLIRNTGCEKEHYLVQV